MRWGAVGAAGIAALAVSVFPAAVGTAAAPACAADALSLNTRITEVSGPNAQNHLELELTNTSAQACALQGFPGVDLVGAEHPTFGPVYQIPRQVADAAPVTIEPGRRAISVLTYLTAPPEDPNSWTPGTIVVTPPDTTTQLQTPWPAAYLTIQRQDAATHPGTFVGPLRAV
ncbi:DUF4232 domain-containing protein [Nocardia mexicana]|uniref:Uncharacterized protein DUF4232 n=1 Tax=Nocardia mexicana TaxID=279262 RepID=A0A370HEM9_9NOCA|nr:DUF4232 domain-containing protein [Nocardia mexicana]RDI55698.1 uncharacterized protein DUF4232 [Nocardia mexicana]